MEITVKERENILFLLRRPDLTTMGFVLMLTVAQLTLAMTVTGLTLGFFLKVVVLGAPLSHGLYMLNLEFSNNLCFGLDLLDRAGGVISNLATGVPYSELVRYFDAEHRAFHESSIYRDPDQPSQSEIQSVRGAGVKIAYLCLYPLVYLHRLLFRHSISFNRFLMMNVVCQGFFNTMILYWYGAVPLLFLWISTYVSMCPWHPFSAHVLMQHTPLQKNIKARSRRSGVAGPYSYYGIVNAFTFNAGFHRERHLEPGIPWSRLPFVKMLNGGAQNRRHYTSTLQAIHDFVFTPEISLEGFRAKKPENKHRKKRCLRKEPSKKNMKTTAVHM